MSFTVVLAAIVATATPAADAPASDRGCRLSGYRTVTSASPITVVRERRGPATNATHLACYGKSGRPLVLGDEHSDEYLSGVVVRGLFVAVRLYACDRDGVCSTTVQVSNVRRRVQVLYETGAIRDLVLTGRGSIAAMIDGPDSRAVVTGRAGAVTEVARGRDIDPRSLTRSAGGVSWMQAGQRRSAAIP